MPPAFDSASPQPTSVTRLLNLLARAQPADREGFAAAVYEGMTPLSPSDVAEVVHFAASRPAHVDIAEVLVLPTDQASATHVHRRRR